MNRYSTFLLIKILNIKVVKDFITTTISIYDLNLFTKEYNNIDNLLKHELARNYFNILIYKIKTQTLEKDTFYYNFYEKLLNSENDQLEKILILANKCFQK